MLTPLQQRTLWESWFGAETRAYYFADLSAFYRTRQRVITWLSLFGSSGALAAVIGTLLSPRWPWLPAVVALVPTGLGLYSLVADNQQRAADSRDLHSKWNALASEYRRLWDDMYADNAPQRLAALEAKGLELSAPGIGLPYIEARMARWYDHVEREHRAAAAHAADGTAAARSPQGRQGVAAAS